MRDETHGDGLPTLFRLGRLPAVGKTNLDSERVVENVILHAVGQRELDLVALQCARKRRGVALLPVLHRVVEARDPKPLVLERRNVANFLFRVGGILLAFGVVAPCVDQVVENDVPSTLEILLAADPLRLFLGFSEGHHLHMALAASALVRVEVVDRVGAARNAVDAAARNRVLCRDLLVRFTARVGDAAGEVVGDVVVDRLERVAVHRLDLLVGRHRHVGVLGLVVRRVRLEGVAGVRELLPVGPRAVESSVLLVHAVVGDHEPRKLDAELLGKLKPPLVVGLAVVVDGDRTRGKPVARPQAHVRLARLRGPHEIGRRREASALRGRRKIHQLLAANGGKHTKRHCRKHYLCCHVISPC